MDRTDYEQLGQRVKKLRQELNLTQADVANALNVTPGYISNVENNRTAMSLRILVYFAKLNHISLDSLVGLIDSDYSQTALDREVMNEIGSLTVNQKKKLLETLKIWQEH